MPRLSDFIARSQPVAPAAGAAATPFAAKSPQDPQQSHAIAPSRASAAHGSGITQAAPSPPGAVGSGAGAPGAARGAEGGGAAAVVTGASAAAASLSSSSDIEAGIARLQIQYQRR